MKTPRSEVPDESPHDAGDTVRFEVDRPHHGVSVLDYLDAVAGPVDRRRVGSAARAGRLLLNDEPVGPAVTLRTGDVLELTVAVQELARQPRETLDVLHADDELLVANKPSGMPFDAGRAGSGRSALEQLSTGDSRPRAVHRLDKDTSGVVVLARSREAAETLATAFREGRARVEYVAVIRGRMPDETGRVDVPLGKRRRSDAELVADPKHGRPCATTWHVEDRMVGFSWLRLVPEGGGRSHQVRAHLAAEGHPVLCDQLYGEDDRILLSQLKLDYKPKRGRPERPILHRPALHAERLVWDTRTILAPLPSDLEVLLAQLHRRRAPGTSGSPRD